MVNPSSYGAIPTALVFWSFVFHASILLTPGSAYVPLSGVTAISVRSGDPVDLSTFLTTPSPSSSDDKKLTLLILGTYAADFNAIEYAQRLRYYMPSLREKGVSKFGFVLNCETDAAKALADLVDLDVSPENIELFVDTNGQAGRTFGVGRGWKPDDMEMSPYLKLFGMLWGLGAWATLPAVIGGYIGNPFRPQPWIEDALAVGQRKGRWPDNALDLDSETGDVKLNKFTELPLVGNWPRRPLELATLRLQNMLDISIKNWKNLAPTEEALKEGILTQLGGCVVVDSKSGKVIYEYRDPGICAVANFEDMLEKLS